MFIGREFELDTLEELYSRKGPKTCAVYGRRRIGKTSLIDHFCEGKDHLRISFTLSTEAKNAEIMLYAMERYTGMELESVKDFMKALEILSKIIKKRNVVVFMDEFPYLVEKAPHAPSVLQHFIDHDLKDSDSMLIVCGSSISMMKEQIENTDMPLYGRFINHIHLEQLPYWDCESFHEGMSRMDCLKIYMTIGGFPAYHENMCQADYRQCIIRNFLGPAPPLADESSTMVAREMPSYPLIEAILSDVARGTTSIKQIAEKEGISQAICGKYIDKLTKLEMVDAYVPMANSDQKSKIIRICDPMLDFRHTVINRNLEIATSQNREKAYDLISHSIDSFLGHRFEYVCAEYIRRRYMCTKVGKWWGWTGECIAEIDIVAEATDGVNHFDILAECKMTKRPVGVQVLNDLESDASFVKGVRNPRYILFSANGFTDELLDIGDSRNDLTLVDLNQLFSF